MSKEDQELEDLKKELSTVEEGEVFYFITLTAGSDGNMHWSAYSEFTGFTESTPRYELRVASKVIGSSIAKTLRSNGEPFMVVRSERALYVFLLSGGHGLVSEEIVRKHMPHVLESKPVALSGVLGLMKGVDGIDKQTLQHAPTRKHRMRILERDGYKCRICGRSPERNVDIELHVHHVRPWAERGLTEDGNLITLCHTCHLGLEPHKKLMLFNRLP